MQKKEQKRVVLRKSDFDFKSVERDFKSLASAYSTTAAFMKLQELKISKGRTKREKCEKCYAKIVSKLRIKPQYMVV